MKLARSLSLCALIVGGIAQVAGATPVTLQNPTSTFNQTNCTGTWSVDQAIDGITAGNNGWAIAHSPDCIVTNAETAWFETAVNQGPASFTFTMSQLLGNFHTIGDFELSYTTDARVGGFSDTATWIPLVLTSAVATNGATLTITGNEVEASGTNPLTSVYTIITANVAAANITGFRIGTLLDPDFFQDGPGRQPTNGNFVLTELQIEATPVGADTQSAAVPEPGTLALFGIGLAGLALARRRRA